MDVVNKFGIYQEVNGSSEYKKNTKMFKNPSKEIVGLVVIFLMILTSNAGGISGADTNIPLMLVFHEIFYL